LFGVPLTFSTSLDCEVQGFFAALLKIFFSLLSEAHGLSWSGYIKISKNNLPLNHYTIVRGAHGSPTDYECEEKMLASQEASYWCHQISLDFLIEKKKNQIIAAKKEPFSQEIHVKMSLYLWKGLKL
jgi:hypothetical protein